MLPFKRNHLVYFEIAMSLGTNCQCRYHISRILYIRANGSDDKFFIGPRRKEVVDYGSFFFDWSFTQIKSTISILTNNFESALELENLQIVTSHNGKQTILDSKTGCRYPHTFPKTKVGEYTSELLCQSHGPIKQKYDYIIKKTQTVLKSDKNILFVLTGNHSRKDVLEVCKAIELHKKDYKLLYTPWMNKPGYILDPVLAEDERVIIRPIIHEQYPGNCQSWEKAFENLDLRIPC